MKDNSKRIARVMIVLDAPNFLFNMKKAVAARFKALMN